MNECPVHPRITEPFTGGFAPAASTGQANLQYQGSDWLVKQSGPNQPIMYLLLRENYVPPRGGPHYFHLQVIVTTSSGLSVCLCVHSRQADRQHKIPSTFFYLNSRKRVDTQLTSSSLSRRYLPFHSNMPLVVYPRSIFSLAQTRPAKA